MSLLFYVVFPLMQRKLFSSYEIDSKKANSGDAGRTFTEDHPNNVA